jgi:hypothetical protein
MLPWQRPIRAHETSFAQIDFRAALMGGDMPAATGPGGMPTGYCLVQRNGAIEATALLLALLYAVPDGILVNSIFGLIRWSALTNLSRVTLLQPSACSELDLTRGHICRRARPAPGGLPSESLKDQF